MRKLYQALRSLTDSPQRGRLGGGEGTRELLFPSLPYIAVYRVREQSVDAAYLRQALERP